MPACIPCFLPGLIALGTAGVTAPLVNSKKHQSRKKKKITRKKKLTGGRKKKVSRQKNKIKKRKLTGGRKRIGSKKDSIRLQKKEQNKYKKCNKSCRSKSCKTKCLKQFKKDWASKDKYLKVHN